MLSTKTYDLHFELLMYMWKNEKKQTNKKNMHFFYTDKNI